MLCKQSQKKWNKQLFDKLARLNISGEAVNSVAVIVKHIIAFAVKQPYI